MGEKRKLYSKNLMNVNINNGNNTRSNDSNTQRNCSSNYNSNAGSNSNNEISNSLVKFYLSQYKSPNNKSCATKWLTTHSASLNSQQTKVMNNINAKYYIAQIIKKMPNKPGKDSYKKRLKELYYWLNDDIKNQINELNEYQKKKNVQNVLNKMKIDINISELFEKKLKLKK